MRAHVCEPQTIVDLELLGGADVVAVHVKRHTSNELLAATTHESSRVESSPVECTHINSRHINSSRVSQYGKATKGISMGHMRMACSPNSTLGSERNDEAVLKV